MTTVRATCPDCGDVRMRDDEVTLRICLDNDEATFRFKCPNCKRLVLKAADTLTVQLLSSTGVKQETWTLPLELSERRPGGDPITDTDITNFHDLLWRNVE